MKRVLIIAVGFLISAVSSSFKASPEAADELKWEEWNTGYPKGLKEQKIILIDAYTEWCGWCKKMDRDTYTNADIIKKINKNFIPIKFNPELNKTYYIDSTAFTGRELHAMLSKEYSTGYPTTYFIVTTKNRLFINPGYENAEQFSKTLDKMIAESKKD